MKVSRKKIGNDKSKDYSDSFDGVICALKGLRSVFEFKKYSIFC